MRSLNIGNVPGIVIPIGENHPEQPDDYRLAGTSEFSARPCEYNVYDIIASFRHLKNLQFFVNEPWDTDDGNPHSSIKVPEGTDLPNLHRLEVGGCISKTFLLALLSASDKLRILSCVALQGGISGQDYGPPPMLFLASLQQPFPDLTTLHLCKIAELSGDRNDEASGLRWPFERDNDRAVLKDWADFLRHVSDTLVELTLEDRYLVN